MNQLISNVLMQPKLDAVERPLTLVEKLEQKASQYLQYQKCAEALHDVCYFGGNVTGLVEAIEVVKQHQAESGWISADERLPNEDGKYLVYCVGNRELTKDRKELSIMRFNQKTKGGWFALSPLFKVIYWQPIQPPSEVQA